MEVKSVFDLRISFLYNFLADEALVAAAYQIRLRNVCLDIIPRLLVQPDGTSLNIQ